MNDWRIEWAIRIFFAMIGELLISVVRRSHLL